VIIMTSSPYDSPDPDIALSADDVLRAADEGVLARADAERLVAWGRDQAVSGAPRQKPVEAPKGLNLVTVAYYSGAMLVILACAWFLAEQWDELGAPGVLATVVVYGGVATGLGVWVRRRGFVIAGGLLFTIAVGLVPLVAYAVEDLAGLWPSDGSRTPGPWMVVEAATIVAAVAALVSVRFAFVVAPLAVAGWAFALDTTALVLGKPVLDGDQARAVSIAFGVAAIVIGVVLDRAFAGLRSERVGDFAFWCHLAGLFAAWGAVTSMESSSELGRALYAAGNVGLIGAGVWLRRSAYVVFGVVGVHLYLGHLAYEVFKDSVLFPFSIALLGLSLIVATVVAQRFLRRGAATA
jgi:hypothetical protein